MQMCTYLTFPGTCLEAFEFYAEVFGGEIGFVQLVKDSPMAEQLPPEMQDMALHARVLLPGGQLMGSDNVMGGEIAMKGIQLQTSFDDLDKAKRVFSRLSKNGSITMDFAPTFWAAGFGACIDRYGIPWMVNCDAEN